MDKKIKNPCVSECKYNQQDVCIACKRTKKEIIAWTSMTDTEKAKVIERINSFKKNRY